MDRVLFSSKSDSWSTPSSLFAELDQEFHFDLDPCADVSNHKCELFFTKEDDGLSKDWCGHRVFCNPPYGRFLPMWVRKCSVESLKPNTLVVMLIPARTDTSYFHDFIYKKVKDLRFLRGRLHFNDSKTPAPFPSMIVVF